MRKLPEAREKSYPSILDKSSLVLLQGRKCLFSLSKFKVLKISGILGT
jgi:hypothetical protein